ncbi:MAG: hypothetical protein JW967_01255 [Dehalococcoidales bacterium]|nr:hypothetical protein [Dehalococcoidales bacterium]
MTNNSVVKAKLKERMVEVKVRFWTHGIDGLPEGYIIPKHTWTRGIIRIESNDSYGIKPVKTRHFNSLIEIPNLIEKVLIDHNVKLHRKRNTEKYIV